MSTFFWLLEKYVWFTSLKITLREITIDFINILDLYLKSQFISHFNTVINKRKILIYTIISQKENTEIFPTPTGEKKTWSRQKRWDYEVGQFLWFSWNSRRKAGKSQSREFYSILMTDSTLTKLNQWAPIQISVRRPLQAQYQMHPPTTQRDPADSKRVWERRKLVKMFRGIKLSFLTPLVHRKDNGIFPLKHNNVKKIQRHKEVTACEITI